MLEVFTVGGGDYLVNTFNAIAAWTGSGGFKSLIRVVMVMGLIYALLATAMDFDWRVWFRWFLQSTLIYTVLMVPTVTVKVTDRINPGLAPSTIANVPIGLGVMASFTSQVSDYLTRTAETVFVMPGALQYSNGGFAYGARMWDKLRGFEVRDPVFKANLDSYLKQCTYYDILLGQKSLKLLSESNDLWAAIGVDAATNRGMKYLTDTGLGSVDIEGKTCAQSWAALDGAWNTQIDNYALPFARSMYPKLTAAAASARLSADVPVVSQLLTGTATARNDFLKQKSVIDAFEAAQIDFGNDDADAFALQRADAQTRNSMTTAAEQGMVWIPVLNIVLTVVFYALFPIVFPLFLFPKTGVATLKGYFAGFFYLAAWGPIYVLIHMFIMDRLASQTNATSPGGTSLATWAGIDAVNQDIATMAGFLMMSVPVLALMVMRGTMSVAGSVGQMLSPVQSGSDAASTERTTGNYTYGDVSHSNYSGNNHQQSQWQLAPSIATGLGRASFTGDNGVSFANYGNGRPVVNSSGGMDVLPFSAKFSRGYTSDLRQQGQEFLSEADRIENGTSTTWSSSRGKFGSSVSTDSSATGDRWERGSRGDRTTTTGGLVTISGQSHSGDEHSIRQGYSQNEGNRTYDSQQGTYGDDVSLGVNGSATLGTPGQGAVGSGANVGLGGAWNLRRTDTEITGREHSRGATNSTDIGDTKSSGTSGSVTVAGSSGTSTSSGSFRSNSAYGDKSHTQSDASGTDWRVTEGDERRQAAAEYREIGNRMVQEASYAESHNFQVSSDMSNLIFQRYEQARKDHPEMLLPELSDPNLNWQEMQRRDAGVAFVMSDLMGDLRNRRIDELGDVAGVGSMSRGGSLGVPGDGRIGGGSFSARGGLPVVDPAGSGGAEGGRYSLIPVGRGDDPDYPIAGGVRSGVGSRVHPVTGQVRDHQGVDIPAPVGTSIVAQAGGVVSRNDYEADGAGNYVVVDHGNGLQTKYLHMNSASPLAVGAPVAEGAVIGQVGQTGGTTGPHLHYEISDNGRVVDPQRFRIGRTHESGVK